MDTVLQAPPQQFPARPRVNWRLVGFLALVSLPFAWFLYVFLNQTLSGGIKDYGDYKHVDLKALGNFPFDEVRGTENDLPQRFRELDGQRVMLEG